MTVMDLQMPLILIVILLERTMMETDTVKGIPHAETAVTTAAHLETVMTQMEIYILERLGYVMPRIVTVTDFLISQMIRTLMEMVYRSVFITRQG